GSGASCVPDRTVSSAGMRSVGRQWSHQVGGISRLAGPSESEDREIPTEKLEEDREQRRVAEHLVEEVLILRLPTLADLGEPSGGEPVRIVRQRRRSFVARIIEQEHPIHALAVLLAGGELLDVECGGGLRAVLEAAVAAVGREHQLRHLLIPFGTEPLPKPLVATPAAA